MTRKTYSGAMSVKSTDAGQVECVFATLQVWDHDNDWTEPGAFGVQESVILEGWNHDHRLPVGKGRVFERGNEAIFSGRFFLETQPGRDHFETVKQVMPEWSYTFDILDYKPTTNGGRPGRKLRKLSVIGVSPVTRGAGINTRVLSIAKSRTRSELLALIDGLKSPRDLRAMIDDQLFQSEIDNVNRRVDLAKGRRKSRLEAYREELLAEGHSPAWVNVVVDAEIHNLARYLRNQHPELYYLPDAVFQQEAARLLR